MTLFLTGQAPTKSGLVISDPTSAAVNINRSSGAVLADSIIRNSKLRGIGDFDAAQHTRLVRLVVVNNGRDGQPFNGDGILIQSAGCEVGWCVVALNGDNAAYEHGLYLAGVARDAWVHDCTFAGNAAAAAKLGGTGMVERCVFDGKAFGLVFDGDVPGDVFVRNCVIRATIGYAIQVDANTRLERFHSDFNVFGPGSRFNVKGKVVDLPGWRTATGMDLHSIEAAA